MKDTYEHNTELQMSDYLRKNLDNDKFMNLYVKDVMSQYDGNGISTAFGPTDVYSMEIMRPEDTNEYKGSKEPYVVVLYTNYETGVENKHVWECPVSKFEKYLVAGKMPSDSMVPNYMTYEEWRRRQDDSTLELYNYYENKKWGFS
ncbi:hypothetical protein [Lactobacillus phage Lbab1]|jgi:hypothetical protein|nr:hypothetical protein [Lactobacillus phage Lbab1]